MRTSGGSLECQQFLPERLSETTAELGQQRGQHEMRLGAGDLPLRNPAGLPYGAVGAQLATELFLGAVQFLPEEFQRLPPAAPSQG